MYKKQSEKAVETGLDDVAGEILAKVKSAGQKGKQVKILGLWLCEYCILQVSCV